MYLRSYHAFIGATCQIHRLWRNGQMSTWIKSRYSEQLWSSLPISINIKKLKNPGDWETVCTSLMIMLIVSLFAFADDASKEQRGIVKCGVTGLKTRECLAHAVYACGMPLVFIFSGAMHWEQVPFICPKCIDASILNQGPFDTLRYTTCSVQSYNAATKSYMNKFWSLFFINLNNKKTKLICWDLLSIYI